MKLFFTSLVLFSLTIPVFTQHRVQTELHDTTLTLLPSKNPEQVLEQPIVVLPLTFAIVTPEQNTQMSLYQTFAGTPQSFAWTRNEKSDLTAPLKLQLYQGKAEKTWRITLGAASTAGALYIAYKHLKKYGLK